MSKQGYQTLFCHLKNNLTFYSVLLQGDFGPFNPGMPIDVPAWLAVTLKQQNKCKIHCPDWLDVGMISD